MWLCVGFKSQCLARVLMSAVMSARAVSTTNNNYMCAATGYVCVCVCVCVCVSFFLEESRMFSVCVCEQQ